MPCPSSGCFVMTRSVRQHKIVKGGKLQKSDSSLICVIVHKCLASFHKHPCPLLHSSLLVQQGCPSLVSDQWHSVAGHTIFLYFVVIVVWCGGVCLHYCDGERDFPQADGDEPAGDCDIPWQCSRCPCKQEIQRHARVYHQRSEEETSPWALGTQGHLELQGNFRK